MRKLICALLTCVMVAGCLPVSADASDSPNDAIVWQEDLNWEQIDLSRVVHPIDSVMPMTNTSANASVSSHSIYAIAQSIYLPARSTVTFNCSYSPSSASMDFGVITSSGRFYYINVKEGSINQAIEISESGSYSVAIRNNSSQTVSVVGFVDY